MRMTASSYEGIKGKLWPGDIIAFGGRGRTSSLIKIYTQAPVSHVAIVLHGEMLIESTMQGGKHGVAKAGIEATVNVYHGDVWYLPLRNRSDLDVSGMQTWLLQQEGKPYDTIQAAFSAIDFMPNVVQSYTKLFCSELAAGGLKEGGILPRTMNASEVTPIDLCRFDIYQDEYFQIRGDVTRKIVGYRSIIPDRWDA